MNIHVIYCFIFHTHHALSLNEIGAVPGGAFKAFCEPVYRISISAWREQTHEMLGTEQDCLQTLHISVFV